MNVYYTSSSTGTNYTCLSNDALSYYTSLYLLGARRARGHGPLANQGVACRTGGMSWGSMALLTWGLNTVFGPNRHASRGSPSYIEGI